MIELLMLPFQYSIIIPYSSIIFQRLWCKSLQVVNKVLVLVVVAAIVVNITGLGIESLSSYEPLKSANRPQGLILNKKNKKSNDVATNLKSRSPLHNAAKIGTVTAKQCAYSAIFRVITDTEYTYCQLLKLTWWS